MSGEMEFYLVAVLAVTVLGLSKGGFSGLSSLAMPMLSLMISPVRAAAIVLPVLVVQDWVSVWAFRRDFSPRNLVILVPSAMIGVAFAGTTTMFFAAVNLLKVPAYFLLGQFSRENLMVSASLIPVAILSTFAGVWLVRRVSADKFYAIHPDHHLCDRRQADL